MKKISKTYLTELKQRIPKTTWWIPIWKGLIVDFDGKHHKKIGSSLWLYLYLLLSVNRKNGIVSKKQKDIAKETGLNLRTIQNHLFRLKANKYIMIEDQSKPLKIHITKYKLFKHKVFND